MPEQLSQLPQRSGTAAGATAAYPEELFNALLDLRSSLADQSGRPPYMVFEERTAREVATYRPATEDELLATWGMGQTRMRWFGDHILGIVREWVQEHPDAEAAPDRPYDRQRIAARADDGVVVSFDDPLYQRLRAWRRDRARADGVPAYTLFTDRTARELAALRPASEADLRGVWGLGDSRVRAFGADLLEVIRAID